MPELYDKIWTNAVIATADAAGTAYPNGAMAVRDGHIAWLGPVAALPGTADTVVDVEGRLRNNLLEFSGLLRFEFGGTQLFASFSF